MKSAKAAIASFLLLTGLHAAYLQLVYILAQRMPFIRRTVKNAFISAVHQNSVAFDGIITVQDV